MRVPRGESGGRETGTKQLTSKLRDQGFGAAVHDPQEEHHKEDRSQESKARKNADGNKRGTLRKAYGLNFVFPLCRDGLFDAIQSRIDLFAVALRGGFSIQPGLFHPARGGGRVLPGLLDANEH